MRAPLSSTPNVQHLDATARAGDICALLVPNYNQNSIIQAQLEGLRGQFGGESVSPLYVVCQRFRTNAEGLERLKPHFGALIQTI
ncbi:MAG: hypothetical protein ACRCYY_15445 [Trueperaceae bacterium]